MTIITTDASQYVELHQHILGTVHQALTTTETPGAAVTLLLNGRLLVSAAVGHTEPARTAELDVHAQFYIYSVTKMLLATLVLQLVQNGRVRLDAPVQTYLTQLALDTPVTIRQLLNHTGGLPDYGALPSYQEAVRTQPTDPWSDDDFLLQTLSNGLVFTPGQGWGYSNLGFLLLRQVVEVVTGKSCGAAVRQQIVAPLGLQQTFVAQTLDDARQLTPGYSAFFSRDRRVQDVRSLYHPGWVAHGVVVATAPELATVIDALFSGHLLAAPGLAAMLEPVLVPYQHPFFQQPAYGLGVMIDPQSQYGLIAGHGGGGPGYSAGALHIPNVHGRRITSIVLANRDQDELGLRMAFTLAMMVADLL
jgi:D-alanyl-D-alanine carboxypeptidase